MDIVRIGLGRHERTKYDETKNVTRCLGQAKNPDQSLGNCYTLCRGSAKSLEYPRECRSVNASWQIALCIECRKCSLSRRYFEKSSFS